MADLTKLPKWAQEHIADLQRQRDTAVRALNEYCDNQTPSPFQITDWKCTGERQGPSMKVRYVQTNRMEIVWKGVELFIVLRPQENGIDLQWRRNDYSRGLVAFVPTGYHSAQLVNPDEVQR